MKVLLILFLLAAPGFAQSQADIKNISVAADAAIKMQTTGQVFIFSNEAENFRAEWPLLSTAVRRERFAKLIVAFDGAEWPLSPASGVVADTMLVAAKKFQKAKNATDVNWQAIDLWVKRVEAAKPAQIPPDAPLLPDPTNP